MEGKQGGKLVIPVRQYAPKEPLIITQTNCAQRINHVSTFEEVKRGPIGQPNNMMPENKLQTKNPTVISTASLNPDQPIKAEIKIEQVSKIKEKFNMMRKNIISKSEKNIIKLTKEYHKNLELMKKDLNNEIQELCKLEKFFLDELVEKPKNVQVKANESAFAPKFQVNEEIPKNVQVKADESVFAPKIQVNEENPKNAQVKANESVFAPKFQVNQEEFSEDVKVNESFTMTKNEVKLPDFSNPVSNSIHKIQARPYQELPSINPSEADIHQIPVILNSPKMFLFNQSHSNLYFSKDLEKIEIVKLPEDFDEGSNLICFLDSNEILIACTTGSVYFLDTLKNTIKKGPNFFFKRKHFAISYINAWPSILGGVDQFGKSLNTVETLHKFKKTMVWKGFNSMIEPRSHFLAIKHKKTTYVFGGYSENTLATIEQYKKGWCRLPLLLPVPLFNIGLALRGAEIYLFGGQNELGFTQNVFSFDTEGKKFKNENELSSEYFTQINESAKFICGNFYLLDTKNMKIIKYLN